MLQVLFNTFYNIRFSTATNVMATIVPSCCLQMELIQMVNVKVTSIKCSAQAVVG